MRLVLKPLNCGDFAGLRWREDFYRHSSMQPVIPGKEDRAHAAEADPAFQREVSDLDPGDVLRIFALACDFGRQRKQADQQVVIHRGDGGGIIDDIAPGNVDDSFAARRDRPTPRQYDSRQRRISTAFTGSLTETAGHDESRILRNQITEGTHLARLSSGQLTPDRRLRPEISARITRRRDIFSCGLHTRPRLAVR